MNDLELKRDEICQYLFDFINSNDLNIIISPSNRGYSRLTLWNLGSTDAAVLHNNSDITLNKLKNLPINQQKGFSFQYIGFRDACSGEPIADVVYKNEKFELDYFKFGSKYQIIKEFCNKLNSMMLVLPSSMMLVPPSLSAEEWDEYEQEEKHLQVYIS